MKKRILSALLTLGMVLTMLPTAWAVDGTYGPEDDSIRIEIGDEITLTGTEGATHSWTYHAGNGYLDDGMVLTSGEESEDTNQMSFQFTKAGTYSVTHIYRKNAGDFLVKSEAFKVTVKNDSPTMADLEMYTDYTETDTLPIDAASATFAYVLTYHGTGGFNGVDQSFGSEGSIAMEATLTAANEKVLLVPVDKANLDLALPQGYYTVRYDNAAGSDAGSQVIKDRTIYFQVTDFGAINVGSSGLASDGGESGINSENVPEYSTITLNSGVFEDVATEEPGPEPSEYAAYIPQADGKSVYYTQLDTALREALSGETVVLCKDLTDVAVTVDKSITLDLNGHTISGVKHKSVDTGSSTTPQPGNPDPAAITIGSNATGAGEADQPKIESFTLKNGTISVGTGLRLYDDLTALTVENVIFRNNVASNAEQKVGGAAVNWRASDEAAVTSEGTSATFVNCQFLNNKSEYLGTGDPNGGAVIVTNVEKVSFTGCTFTENISTGTNTSNNSTTGSGGAVYTDPYVTSAYGFGANSDGTYQFVLNYYEKGEDGQSDECFVWEINVPVSNFAPVQLTYTVQLTNPKTESGTYGTYDADGSEGYDGLYTNNEATLYPVDSNGVPGQAENFYRPTVSYTVGTVSITPADITIYTGGDGYDSVITDVNGDQVETSAGTGLPTPGFYIELPHEVDQALKEAVGAPLDQPLDLSKYLTFTYDDGQGNTRTWHLERYDNKEGNDSMAYNRYIYRILPAEVNDEEIPIRLQFTDADGTFMTSDDFTVSLDDLFHVYDMTIYAGDLNQKLVKAVITVNDAATEYDATVESGELTVRGVTDNGTHTTDVVTETEAPTNVTSVTAQVGEDAKFYINGSQLEVIDPDDVKLLVDSLVPDQNNTLVNSALDEFDAIPNDYDYEARYLDLVDTSNGNAYVTTDDAVVVYWAYPEGTDENTEFHLVHYVGLDRNSNDDLANGTYTMEYYSEENGNLETTEQGIRFTVNSFSPFTLFWEDDSNNGGGGGGGGSKPELNKEDHIAYVSGYPDGTVQPEGYITREEVATIFFRLLTDESRADFITDYNPYPDVASDRWSYYAITTMTNGNLMLGRTGGVFDPGANITRAEFAVVAAQFSNAQYSGPDKFTDISDHWARDYINRAANEGWIAGYPDGTFGPDRFITRAEVMALVNEVLERAPDADYMLDNMTVWPDNPKSAWYYEDVQEATNSHSYVWRNTQHTSEDWEDFISMRTFNELVRDAFNAAN